VPSRRKVYSNDRHRHQEPTCLNLSWARDKGLAIRLGQLIISNATLPCQQPSFPPPTRAERLIPDDDSAFFLRGVTQKHNL
jgi:hypothetical protein